MLEEIKTKLKMLEEKVNSEEMYREKFDELQKKYDKLQDDFESLKDGSEELKKQFEDALEQLKKVKGIAASTNLLSEEVTRLQKELNELQPLKRLRDALFELLPSKAISASAAGVKITLGTSLTEISLEDNAPKEVSMTTQDPSGKLMYCAVRLHEKKLKDKGKADDKPITFTTAELQREAAEHGWGLTNMMIGKTTGFLIREAYLIKEENALRLPTELKINVRENKQ